ncbi:MAG: peptidoglycan DD-metalloendopeptidase family protein [Hyphomonas sp.]|uniref:M23 family metallopeptidase n=1 Tax=Hyphomonas sp. TaxID=87 RepID=UPI003529ABF7
MRKLRTVLLAGIALAGLAACDFIRFPGDGGPPPSTPEPGPAIPPGAPGPPPPTAPVLDPYGTGDTGTDTGTDATDTNPDAGSDTSSDSGTDIGTDTPDDTGTDTTDAPDPGGTDTADAGDTDPPSDTSGDAGTDTGSDEPTDVADNSGSDTTPPPEPVEPTFSYFPTGALLPGTGEGTGSDMVFAPDMVFPIKDSPAYLQSMVFTFGGGMVGGDQCDARNFEYPWRDNFCETRSANRGSPYCPINKIHQGQDIRVGTPTDCKSERSTTPADRMAHEVVAVEDGVISNVGSYSVNLRSGGRIYKYLHLNMAKLNVKIGDTVKAGDLIGYVSNDFGGTPTVLHLHFEITQNNGNGGWDYVPPYTSLVAAYERRENGPGEEIEEGEAAIASTPFVIPPDAIIIE